MPRARALLPQRDRACARIAGPEPLLRLIISVASCNGSVKLRDDRNEYSPRPCTVPSKALRPLQAKLLGKPHQISHFCGKDYAHCPFLMISGVYDIFYTRRRRRPGRPKWQGWSGSHPRLRSRSVDRPKPLCFESEIVYLELFLVYCSLRILRAKNHVFSTEIRCFGLEIRCAPDRPFGLILVGRRSEAPVSLGNH